MSAFDAYTVFRRKEKPALRCAVRQDRPVPGFVSGDGWEYAGTVDGETAPAGFRAKAAREATSQVGYYVFYVLNA
ncbi:hypothetical protein [Methylobacterium sp. JK268]